MATKKTKTKSKRGSKESYSSKQKRMAKHIEDGYKKRGASKKKAGRIAWATVNKETGGTKRSRSTGSRRRASG